MVKMQWRQQRTIGRNLIYSVALLLLAGLIYVLQQGSVSASSLIDWTAPGPMVVTSKSSYTPMYISNQPGCVEQVITQRRKNSVATFTEQINACVVRGEHVSLAHTGQGMSVSFGSDRYFYQFDTSGTGIGSAILVPGMDRIGFVGSTLGHTHVEVHDNFSARLRFNADTLKYKLAGPSHKIFPAEGQDRVGGVTINFSNNGRYMVYQSGNDYPGIDVPIIRVDLKTGERKWFGIMWYGNYALPIPAPHYVISNDGTTVIGGGIGTLRAWSLSDACLAEPPNYGGRFEDKCPARNISSNDYGEELDPSDVGYTHGLQLSDDASELSFMFHRKNGDHKHITISPSGYTPPESQLDYLALGDSYSSGEGDVGKNSVGGSYYLPANSWVDENGNLGADCHISVRSYPFLLRRQYGISADNMKSVACSGATVYDIAPIDIDYIGQSGRLSQVNPEFLFQTKNQARAEFTPGYVQQIEFVKEYKPRAITLTGGGNDLGFGDVITRCASSSDTCSEALGASGLARAGLDIYGQFTKLTDLYIDLKRASPTTKIYVLGYPSFISNTGTCYFNAGLLNRQEREMINESIKYFNQVIKAATQAAGVVYIDIENSLEGGRMCEQPIYSLDKYVTGFHAVNPLFSSLGLNQSFHPNATGQSKIAERIQEQLEGYSLLDYPYEVTADPLVLPPVPTDYFTDAVQAYDGNARHMDIITEPMTKGRSYAVDTGIYTYEGLSVTTETIYSDPIELGQGAVATDGSYHSTITIPSTVPAGYHTLVLSGKSPAGEPLEFFDTILVVGSDPNDLDENNMLDSQQPCGIFITPSGEDVDLDGTDDACDPYIGVKPELYHVRLGDANRTYNGNPENINYLYIERNTRASDTTGISNDYDPDGDGWAIVGVSNESQLDGVNLENADTVIDFEVIGDGTPNSPYQPIVYIFPENNPCVIYHPVNLDRVSVGESRALSVAKISNDKCPQSLPDDGSPADLDPDPPKDKGLFDRLRSGLQKLRSLLAVIIVQLRSLLLSWR